MVFLERIDALIKERGISRNTVSKNVAGLNHNSFHAWEKRGTIPNGDTIAKIADFFNVSTDYLLGKTDDPTPAKQKKELTPREELVRDFTNMLSRVPDEKLEKLKDLLQASIDAFV